MKLNSRVDSGSGDVCVCVVGCVHVRRWTKLFCRHEKVKREYLIGVLACVRACVCVTVLV